MATEIDFFPHGGEHCENDSRLAHVTLWLLAAFAVAMALGLVFGLRAF